MANEKPNKPSDSDFKQQRLKGWKCSPNSAVLGSLYVVIGIAFILFGCIVIDESDAVVEVSKRYDNIGECKADWRTPRTCIIDIEVDDDMEAPIFFYYEISNFYQNHRKYFKNRDIYQLMGETRSEGEVDKNCEPVTTMDDLGFYTSLDLDGDDVANPCGLIAKSYFNDTFSLLTPDQEELEEIPMKHDKIAWDVDTEQKFEENDNAEEVQWIDVENEHFIVWMNVAGLSSFRKLWGRVEEDLPKGTYRAVIVNNYDVSSFNGQKSIIMSTTSAFGGKVEFIGILYIILGVCALVGAVIIFLTYFLKRRALR